jgi:hypothetical protein
MTRWIAAALLLVCAGLAVEHFAFARPMALALNRAV